MISDIFRHDFCCSCNNVLNRLPSGTKFDYPWTSSLPVRYNCKSSLYPATWKSSDLLLYPSDSRMYQQFEVPYLYLICKTLLLRSWYVVYCLPQSWERLQKFFMELFLNINQSFYNCNLGYLQGLSDFRGMCPSN